MKTIVTLIACIGIALVLTACGFAPRSASEVPPQLHVLYLDSSNPYSPVAVQLQRTLQSVNVHFVNNMKDAPVTLHISSENFTYTIPTILDSSNAASYSYTIKVVYRLQTSTGKIITDPKTVAITRSLIQNANQVYVPNAAALMKGEITRTVVIVLYHDLMSLKTRHALQVAFRKHK